VERVAKCIWEGQPGKPQRLWDAIGENVKNEVRSQARRLIQEMREPTEAMALAGEQVGHYSDAPTAISVWTAMIDEALK
jgi:hypothetical protein